MTHARLHIRKYPGVFGLIRVFWFTLTRVIEMKNIFTFSKYKREKIRVLSGPPSDVFGVGSGFFWLVVSGSGPSPPGSAAPALPFPAGARLTMLECVSPKS